MLDRSYGNKYWCVKVPKTLSKSGEIYFHADRIEITQSGTLIALGCFRIYEKDDTGNIVTTTLEEKENQSLILNRIYWKVVYAASQLDGSPVAVERWEGEIVK